MQFIPGIDLARLFYEEAIRPILNAYFPGLAYSAALIGTGSEVLGFDTDMSTDHSWGPRCFLFLKENDHGKLAASIRLALGHKLPLTFRGFYTHYQTFPGEPNSHIPGTTGERPINHRVVMDTLPNFLLGYTGAEIDKGVTLMDWLLIPEQNLRTLTTGGLFHDGLGTLEPLRQQLAWYPHDVWLYLIASQWGRIGQEEPFVGRTGLVGDETGSAILASRLVRDLMRLCMLLERQYASYPKWFGTAFSKLECAPFLTSVFAAVHQAASWQEREKHLSIAYEYVADKHNKLGITAEIQTEVSHFHDRPFLVIEGGEAEAATRRAITDEAVRALPLGVGKVDQFLDNTDILSIPERCRAMAILYPKLATP